MLRPGRTWRDWKFTSGLDRQAQSPFARAVQEDECGGITLLRQMFKTKGSVSVSVARKAFRFTTVGLGILIVAVAVSTSTAWAQAVSEETSKSPKIAPGSGEFFHCLYERKWPCAVSADQAPSIDQVLAKYEAALGGATALAKVNTRVVTQRRFQDIGTPEDEYLVRYTKKPEEERGRILSIMSDTAIDGTFLRWVNGCDAKGGFSWSGRKDPSGVPHEAKNSTDGLCEQELYFYGYFPLDVQHLRRAFQRFEYKGTHKIFQPVVSAAGEVAGGQGADIIPGGEARDTYLFLGVPASANDEYQWLYFDTKTGLLLRFASAGNNPNWPNSPLDNSAGAKTLSAAGNSTRIVDLLQYRKVGDGTVAPFQFVNQGPETRVRGVIMTMVENAPVDDSVFLRPKNTLRADKGFGE
jgi:hypothetical protein